MNNLEAVFWDVDGTLADTEMNAHRRAFNKAFAEYEIPFRWNKEKYIELLKVAGGFNRIKSYYQSKKIHVDLNLIKKVHILKQKIYIDLMRTREISLRRGVYRLVKELSEANVEQWIVTSSGKASVKAFLNSQFMMLKNPFRGIITGEDVKYNKPSPDVYLMAINKSKKSKKNIIVIEDSFIGYSSAISAGLTCLITPTEWDSTEYKRFSSAIVVLNNLGEPDKPFKIYNDFKTKQECANIFFLQEILNNEITKN